MSSVGVRTAARLSRNTVDADEDVSEKRDVARGVLEVARGHGHLQRPVLFHGRRRPSGRRTDSGCERNHASAVVSARLADSRARSSSDRQVAGPRLENLLELLLCLCVGVRTARALDFLSQRVSRAHVAGIELNGAAVVGDALRRACRVTSRAGPAETRGRSIVAQSTARLAIGAAAASNSPRRRCARPRFAHAAGSPGTSSVVFVNSRFASSSRPTWSWARPR